MATATNIFDDLPEALPTEHFVDLLHEPGIRIERIVSDGQTSPEAFWYEQEQVEWVLLLRGQARLQFDNQEEEINLTAGSFLRIDPRQRHRVTYTAKQTVWLAVWFDPTD